MHGCCIWFLVSFSLLLFCCSASQPAWTKKIWSDVPFFHDFSALQPNNHRLWSLTISQINLASLSCRCFCPTVGKFQKCEHLLYANYRVRCCWNKEWEWLSSYLEEFRARQRNTGMQVAIYDKSMINVGKEGNRNTICWGRSTERIQSPMGFGIQPGEVRERNDPKISNFQTSSDQNEIQFSKPLPEFICSRAQWQVLNYC